MNKLEKTIFGISITGIGFFVILVGIAVWELSDPAYEERQKQREIEELEQIQKAREQKIEQLQEEMRMNELAFGGYVKNYETSKTKENFESAVDEKNILLYRPYWTVGDEWDERERTGQISKNSYCLGLVNKINYGYAQDADPIFKEWVANCLTLK